MGSRLVFDLLACAIINGVYNCNVHTLPRNAAVEAEFHVTQGHYVDSVVDLWGQRQKVPTCLCAL